MITVLKSLRLPLLLVAVALAPSFADSTAQGGTLLFEDLWPEASDLDFNDQVVTYNYEFTRVAGSANLVQGIRATFNVRAVGATLHNGLYLHLPIPSASASSMMIDFGSGPTTLDALSNESELVIPVIADTRTLYPSNAGFINTDPKLLSTPVAHPILIDILFSTPAQLNPGDAPFDLFIARTGDLRHQIHRPQYSGTDQMNLTLFGTGDDGSTATRHFVNTHGLPFALDIPAASGPDPINWPSEKTPIDQLYPQLASFAASGGTLSTDWYDFPDAQFLYAPVPEPSGLALLASGVAGVVVLGRRKA